MNFPFQSAYSVVLKGELEMHHILIKEQKKKKQTKKQKKTKKLPKPPKH